MLGLGILVVMFGFALSVASLGMASSTGARMLLVLLGNGISLTGIIVVVNRAFVQKAIWRK